MQQMDDGFGDDQIQAVLHPFPQTAQPMGTNPFAINGRNKNEHFAILHLNGKGRNIVRPKVKGATAGKVKASMMPRAGQNAVLHRTFVQWEAHVRAAVVNGEKLPVVVEDSDRAIGTGNDDHAFFPHFVHRADFQSRHLCDDRHRPTPP